MTARPLRLWIVGFGTVGQWLARALTERERGPAASGTASRFEVVGVANRRDGFFYRENGLDLRSVGSLSDLPDVRRWPTALEGLRETDADVLVEVSESPPPTGEPGRSHLEEALGRGIPAVTSNKWPVALHGVELAELARSPLGAAARRVDGHVRDAGPEHAERGTRGRVADRRSGRPQRDGELHRVGDGPRAGLCRCPGRRAAQGSRRARSERRRGWPRRSRQGDGPFGPRLRTPAAARGREPHRDLVRDGGGGEPGRSEGRRIREVTTVEGSVAGWSRSRWRPAIRSPGSTGPTTPWSVARNRWVR